MKQLEYGIVTRFYRKLRKFITLTTRKSTIVEEMHKNVGSSMRNSRFGDDHQR
jgi:hypothetical protein